MSVALASGETFAGYRIEAVVGRGGMGVVYRATDLRLERPVALKVVAPELAEDELFRQRFLKEPKLAAALDHPHVVPIYEAGEHEGRLYLAMRYVSGSDMRTLLRQEGGLSPERGLAILDQVAGALDAAHRRDLVHRDVKPANVLVDEDGHAYLTDFGVTKRLGGDTTDTGQIVGTLDYLAPEQIRGEGVSGAADGYALGCVLFECVTGAPPFHRDTEAETLWAHMQDSVPRVPDRPALDPVLRKALAKGPADRYGTCAELVDAAAEAMGVAAPLATRRTSRVAVLLALGGVVLGATVVLALTRSLDETSDPSAQRLDAATNSVAAVDARTSELALAAPLPGRPTDVAAGRGTAWIATVDSTAVTGINIRTRSSPRIVPLSGRADAVAVGEGSVWVADSERGLVSRIETGYERVSQRFRVPASTAGGQPSGRSQAPRASLAVGGGAAWLTSGSKRLVRIDAGTGETAAVPAPVRLDAVAVGGGAVWALSSDSASVLRADPKDGRITDTISIAARSGAEGPFPVAIAASSLAVWVLNGNTAAVTQIDPGALGVVTTIPIGVDRVPTDIAASGGTAWVSNGDGSIARIHMGASAAKEIRVGESLERIAADGSTVWVTTTAFDRKLPGGAG